MSPQEGDSQHKFKRGQHVIIKNMIMNGTRRDVGGIVVQYMTRGIDIDKVEVNVNSVLLHMDESRLEDSTEYWSKKNKESK